MFMLRVLRREKGQALVEFALVLPIFVTLIFMIIDVGWTLSKYLEFDYAYRNASWAMSINYDSDYPMTITGTSANNAIKSAIQDASPNFELSKLSVMNSKIDCWTEKENYYTPKSGGKTEQHTRRWRYAKITSSLAYKINPLTPVGQIFFGSTITVTKNLDKDRLICTREG